MFSVNCFVFSMFPKSTHETFAQKLYQTFQKHKRFVKPKLSRTDFTICHYAGEVSFLFIKFNCFRILSVLVLTDTYTCGIQVLYQSDQFLDKNKDYVVAEHQELLSASKCSFISGLFPLLPEETSKSSKFSSIGARFKVPLPTLLIFLYYASEFAATATSISTYPISILVQISIMHD